MEDNIVKSAEGESREGSWRGIACTGICWEVFEFNLEYGERQSVAGDSGKVSYKFI